MFQLFMLPLKICVLCVIAYICVYTIQYCNNQLLLPFTMHNMFIYILKKIQSIFSKCIIYIITKSGRNYINNKIYYYVILNSVHICMRNLSIIWVCTQCVYPVEIYDSLCRLQVTNRLKIYQLSCLLQYAG